MAQVLLLFSCPIVLYMSSSLNKVSYIVYSVAIMKYNCIFLFPFISIVSIWITVVYYTEIEWHIIHRTLIIQLWEWLAIVNVMSNWFFLGLYISNYISRTCHSFFKFTPVLQYCIPVVVSSQEKQFWKAMCSIQNVKNFSFPYLTLWVLISAKTAWIYKRTFAFWSLDIVLLNDM